MKIALIGYEANIENRVGSNQYAFGVVKSLWEADKENDYRIYLPSPPLTDLPPEREKWRYVVCGPAKFWNFFGLPRSLSQRECRPDIVFIPGHYAPPFCPKPLVISIMDLGYCRFPQYFTRPIYWKLRYWTSFSLRQADRVIAISQSTKNDIIRYEKIDPGKISVIYPGFDQKEFLIADPRRKIGEVKKKYGIKGDYILFLSTLKPSKNIEGLLEAFYILIKKHRLPVKLVVAGRTGWLVESVFRKIEALELKEKVIFTGFVEEKDKPVLMAGALVHVLPSFWEGFGITAIEAMAVGTPVIVSQAGSLPETVGRAGLTVDPFRPEDIAEGVNRVISDQKLREKMIKAGFAQVKKFAWGRAAEKIIGVFRQL